MHRNSVGRRRISDPKLLTPGLIPKLALRQFVLEKDTLHLLSSLPVVVAQSDERLTNRATKKCSALVWLGRRRLRGHAHDGTKAL